MSTKGVATIYKGQRYMSFRAAWRASGLPMSVSRKSHRLTMRYAGEVVVRGRKFVLADNKDKVIT